MQHNADVHISAKSDYAMRALIELAAEADPQIWTTGESIAERQGISVKFLEGIMRDLRNAGLVTSHRGADGGYRLARSAADITIADAVRAVDGPLAAVRGERPEDLRYAPPADALRDVWVALRAAMRDVLETTTIADVVHHELPPHVKDLLSGPDAWVRRGTHTT